MRDDPSLRGKPVAVAGSSRRAVVLTASYEARPFGVRSAIPLYKALAACPQLIVVAPDMAKYKAISREIFAVFAERGRRVEGLSMDEAFVDLENVPIDGAVEIAANIRARVLEKIGLTLSAGVSAAKMVSKIASDLCKPNGLRAIAPGKEAAFLAPLPVGRLWGVGPKTQTRLHTRGITTIGELAELDDSRLHALFGTWGYELRELARGRDSRRVETDRETKSISTEETFEYDVTESYELLDLVRVQSEELAGKLAAEKLSAQTVGIKIKRGDFSSIVRQTHLKEPTGDSSRIYAAAAHCLERAELHGSPVRLLGTRVASLCESGPVQTDLF
ncbi:MAG: DNA polymerase IV [Candidatus Eremiobacteraeota bacterium]|nr:DNA polymerase IV [Candidatus Eremiobacteraeota bacterium]